MKMALFMQGQFSHRLLHVVRIATHRPESIPLLCVNHSVQWLTTAPPLKEQKPLESSQESTKSGDEDESLVSKLVKFTDDHALIPKSSFKRKDVAEDLTNFASDNPDHFGNLSGSKFSKPELIEGDEVDGRDEYSSFKPHRLSQKKYVDMIKKLLNQRRFADALNILQVRMLQEDKVKPEYYVYGILINFCGKVGYTKMAFKLYNQMKGRQLTVTPSIYTSLFNSCANSPYPNDGLTRAKHLKNTMLEKNITPSIITCHAMIKAFGRCGDLQSAFEVGDYMMKNKMTLTCETFSFLFQACISDKEAGFRHALFVYKKMMQYRIEPDCYIFNLLLRCVRDTNLGDYESMIDVLLRVGVKQSEVELLQTAVQKQLESNVEPMKMSYPWEDDHDVMTEVCSGSVNRDKDKISSTLDVTPTPRNQIKVVSKNSVPNFLPNLLANPPTLGSVISLVELKDPADRFFLLGGWKGFLDEMAKYNVKPDYKTASLLLDCIPETCEAENALVKEMRSHDKVLTIGFFNTLIKRRAFRKQYQDAKEVLSMIGAEGAEVDMITYGCLAMTCQSLLEACELVKSMEAVGLRPNIIVLTAFMRVALKRFNFSYINFIFEVIDYEEMAVSPHFIKVLDGFYERSKQILANGQMRENLKAIETMKKFCVLYPKWKKSIRIEEENKNPWEDLKQTYVTTQVDEEFLSNHVEPEHFKANFPRKGPTTSVKVRAAKVKQLKREQPELFLKTRRRRLAKGRDEVEGIEMEVFDKMKTNF